MLGDSENAHDQAIQIILKIRKVVSLVENPKGPHVRQLVIPPIDCKATTYCKMSTMPATTMSELPGIKDKYALAIRAFAENKLLLMPPCHNQAKERHVKLVTEAATIVQEFL